MAKNKVYLMEHVWLVVTIITLVFFTYSTVQQGFKESYIMLILSGISFLMFLWRKALRKKEESEINNQK